MKPARSVSLSAENMDAARQGPASRDARGVRALLSFAVCDDTAPICPRCGQVLPGTAHIAAGSGWRQSCDRNYRSTGTGRRRCGQLSYIVGVGNGLCCVVPLGPSDVELLENASMFDVIRRLVTARAR